MQLKKRKNIFIWQSNHSIHPLSKAQGIKDKHSSGREGIRQVAFFICNYRSFIRDFLSFIIILLCNSEAHSICTLLTVFAIHLNNFQQKENKQQQNLKINWKSQLVSWKKCLHHRITWKIYAQIRWDWSDANLRKCCSDETLWGVLVSLYIQK